MESTESTEAMESMESTESMESSVVCSCWLEAISKSDYLC